MKPDNTFTENDGLTISQICILAGINPDLYAGYVTVLVPAKWTADGAPLVTLTDAPQPGAAITVLSSAISDLAARIQMSGESSWDVER